MPRLAANLTMLFTELDVAQRFAAAAEAGFRGVEYQFPYHEDEAEFASALREHDLEMVLQNLPPGDWAAGERGIACHPERAEEFRDSVETAVASARALGCSQINCLAGIAPPGVAGSKLRATFVENLDYAAGRLAREGMHLLIEPINTRDVPGFFLSRSDQALAVIEEVGAANLKLQYDVYHMQIMQGDIVRTLEECLEHVGHVQIADNPGRHEPGTGELNFEFILDALDRMGYAGWVSCEYRPRAGTLEGLSWARPYLGKRRTET